MVSISGKLIVSLLFVGILYTTDATITAWTEPAISDISGTPSTGYTFAEDIATGTAGVGKTFAVTGEGAITFTLLTTGTPFSVASATGVLSLDTALDFETTPTYSLEVQAVDTTNPSTGTATITVTVTDANDAPAFAQSVYNVNIADGSTAGALLTTITATDQDGDTITYSIAAGNSAGHFSIVGDTGVITVATSHTLEASTTAAYDLQIEAADDDSPSLTGTTTIKVTVQSRSGSSGLLAGSLLVLMMSLFALLK